MIYRSLLILKCSHLFLERAAAGYGSCGDEVSEKDDFNINLNRIIGIVTLGAPNIEPPPGVMDMTRGALRY